MPSRPGRPCAHPGCGRLVRGKASRCTLHKKARARARWMDDQARRPPAHRRGYDSTWRRVRATQLKRQPLCEDCLAAGRTTAAQMVHHHERVDAAPHLRLAPANLVSLCNRCHARRHAEEDTP